MRKNIAYWTTVLLGIIFCKDQILTYYSNYSKNDLIVDFVEIEDGLHHLLEPAELHYMFGTTDKSKINHEEYTVVAIKDILNQEKEVAKRSGQPAPDAAYQMNAFGNNYNLK